MSFKSQMDLIRFLVLAHLLGDADKHAKFRRQVNILTLLLDFKQGLIQTHDLLIVLLAEVLHHGDGLTGFPLLKAGSLGTHIPPDAAHLVGLVVTVAGHDDCVLELVVDCLLDLDSLWGLAGIALALLSKAHHLFIDEFEAVVD
jgi:hypothetical protein